MWTEKENRNKDINQASLFQPLKSEGQEQAIIKLEPWQVIKNGVLLKTHQ